MQVSKYAKSAVAVVGFVATVVAGLLQAGNVIPAQYTPYVVGVLSVLTALGVYHVPNKPNLAAGFDDGGKDAGHADLGCVLVAAAVSIVVLTLAVVLKLV